MLTAGCADDRSAPGSSISRSADRSDRDTDHDNPGNKPGDKNKRGAAGAIETQARFVDRASAAGVEFTYRNGEEAGHYAILESLGGGVAMFDYDADGDLDLFFPGGGRFDTNEQVLGLPGALYRNENRWQFADVTEAAGVASAPYYSHGAIVGDYDNDGFRDLLVTGYGGLVLYQNLGDGTFIAVTGQAGLTDTLWSSSAAWGDLDGDGNLDLYVAHYVNWSFQNHPHCPGPKPGTREVCSPREFDPLPDTLYLSNGEGTFRDASREVALSTEGKGLGVLMADVDLDGDLDIYVANDTVPNFLYRNERDSSAPGGSVRLAEMGLMSGTSLSDTGVADGSMGVDLGDYNLDGLPDLWVANFERESFALYRNEGDFFFQHVSQATGVTAVGGLYVGWGTVFFDFDRDGDEDVFVSNGHVIRYPVNAPVRQQPLLYENLDGQRLVNVAPAAGEYMSAPHMGRGVAMGDLDSDGDIDLAVSHTNEPVVLLENVTGEAESGTAEPRPADPHWLGVRLIGTQSPRDAVGAVVRLKTAAGEQVRQVRGGASYASSHDLRLLFGLGEQSTVEQIEITWPSGTRQVIDSPPTDRVLTVPEPNALQDASVNGFRQQTRR